MGFDVPLPVFLSLLKHSRVCAIVVPERSVAVEFVIFELPFIGVLVLGVFQVPPQ